MSDINQELLKENSLLKQRIRELEQTEAIQSQTEEARRESERRFHSLVEATSDLIWEIDVDGFYTYVSPKAKDLFGYEPEELIGKSPFDLMPADERERVYALFKKIEDSRRSFSGLENINLHKDGREVVIESNGVPIFDGRGNYLGCRGFDRDITGRKRAEERIRNSANRVQRQNDAIMRLATDETIATGDMRRIFGLLTETASEAIEVDRASIWLLSEDEENLSCVDLYESGTKTHTQGVILKRADYPNYFMAIRNTRRIIANDARQDPNTMEFRDGYLVPLGITSMLDVGIYLAGKMAGVVCFEHTGIKREWHADEEAFANTVAALAAQALVNMDRKRAEEAMLSEQLFTKALLDSLPGIFYLYTYPELRLVRWNKNHETLLGYGPGEINDCHIMDWHVPEAKEAVRQAIETGMGKGFNMIESPLLTKDGRRIPFLMTGIRFEILGKSYLMGVGIDITERKRAEEALADEITRRRILVEQSRDGIVVLDWDGRAVETNKCFARMLGYSPEEVLQLHVWDWDGALPRERLLEMVRSVDEKGDHFETRHRRKDGALIDVEISSNGAMFGQQKMVFCVCRDITERKLAEDELQKLASVVMNSSELVNLATLDGKMIYLNDAGTRMLGISPDELAGRHIMDVIPEHLLKKVRKEITPAMMAGVRWEGDLEYRNLKTGALTPVHAIIFLISDSKTGAPLYFANVAMDITERKRAEEALRNSETSLAAAQAIAHMGSWEYDIVTQTVTLSDELFRIFGFDPALGVPPLAEFFNIVHPDDRERTRLNRDQNIAKNRPFSDEYRIVRSDGSVRWIEIQCDPVVDNSGNLIKDIGTAQDITERKLAELALREAENRYRLLFDQSPDGIMILDPETGRFLDFNEAACGQLGYSREEFAGLTLADFLFDEKPEDIRRRQGKIMREGWDDFEISSRTRQGEIKNFHVTTRVTEILGRKVFHSVIRDITESRKLQAQLRQAQKLEGLGQLAGGIAHDFNNVLSAVMGLTELIIMDMSEDNPARHNAEEILKAVNRGADLTRQILAFSRQQALEMKPVNINDTIRDLQKMLRRLVREDITINLRLSDEELNVMADRAQIDQVLMNLSTNAGDAMTDGGNIDISTGAFVMDEGFVATHGYGSPGNYAHIAFSDTGCGMDAETIANIFDPFFTTKERGKGTGLGLAVVHGILKQHNGHINVYSEPGKGTVFNLYLPLTGARFEKTAVPSPGKPRGGTETLLIAEDDDLVRDISVTALASFGYKIIEAVDGEDAINKFAENSGVVSLAILDGIMPKKNGMEVFEAIRKLRPDIKAIFLSGYTDGSFDHNELSGMGAIFMQKPVKPTELLRKVREMLDAV
jgi:two-component system, cell cycle sensor histidine kinase and response regulator CckA